MQTGRTGWRERCSRAPSRRRSFTGMLLFSGLVDPTIERFHLIEKVPGDKECRFTRNSGDCLQLAGSPYSTFCRRICPGAKTIDELLPAEDVLIVVAAGADNNNRRQRMARR